MNYVTYNATSVYLFPPKIGIFISPLLLYIDFIGMTLVNKLRQVSGAQIHGTSSGHCVVCSLSQGYLLPLNQNLAYGDGVSQHTYNWQHVCSST